MAQPIYKLWLAKFTPAAYQLSPEEQQKGMAKMEEAFVSVGGKRILQCDSAWASEQWTMWGVEQFPDLEALQKYTALLQQMNWFQYTDSVTLLGTESQA